MKASDIPTYRLHAQAITAQKSFADVGKLVSHLGAIQAQDYLAAKWAIGARISTLTDMAVEKAIAEKQIIRTWPMRGTLHFVAASDAGWMLALLTPRILAGSKRRWQDLELTDSIFAKSGELFSEALAGNRQLTRDDMYAVLENKKISTKDQRGYHILLKHAQEGLLCFSSVSGKQQTFALLHEWAPTQLELDREASLKELAKRYFISHGPATLQDFVWWSGLKITEARLAIELASSQLSKMELSGTPYWLSPEALDVKPANSLYLLPGFDEYLLGYTDRSAVLDPQYAKFVCPGNNGMFSPMIVENGHIIGTWKRTLKKSEVILALSPFQSLSKKTLAAIERAAESYGEFLGLSARIA